MVPFCLWINHTKLLHNILYSVRLQIPYKGLLDNKSTPMPRPFLGNNAKAKKTIQRTMRFTERQFEMCEAIAEKNGFNSFQGVIDKAIELYFSKSFPLYAVGRTTTDAGQKTTNMGVKEIAKSKVDMRQAQKDAELENKLEKKRLICKRDLHGRVETDDGGFHYCYFKIHDTKTSVEQKMPLLQTDPVIARSLFVPSKEMVFKARPELKKLYEKETSKKEK